MFIGYTAVGFALKRLAPRAPFCVLLVAVNWADILWTLFLLLGWEGRSDCPGRHQMGTMQSLRLSLVL